METNVVDVTDKLLGSFIGLAVGDAVGTTVEFKDRDTFTPLTDMVGGGPFRLPVGYWTDDTSMALCLAESLVLNPKLSKVDLLERFNQWMTEGYNSSTGICFDIGNTTRVAIYNFAQNGLTVNNEQFFMAGNGSIMRLVPAIICHYDNLEESIRVSREQSLTTHAAPNCVDSCELMANIIHNAFYAETKDDVLNVEIKDNWAIEVQEILRTLDAPRDHISSSGFVIHTLRAACWCFVNTDNFKDAILLAANLGDDADTVAAVTGQIAGAYYGLSGIPKDWQDKLYDIDRFKNLVSEMTQR